MSDVQLPPARPRPKQQEVLNYTHGRMGVAAVPGAGKTWTLSRLAAQLITDQRLGDEQEVLVVTLTNSAVDNFTSRVESFLNRQPGRRLLARNYRVRTLHGLAHDIVRERPALAGLSPDFQILDDNLAAELRRRITTLWLRDHPDFEDTYLDPELHPAKRGEVLNKNWPTLVENLVVAMIRTLKDARITPAELRLRLQRQPVRLPLAEMAAEVYAEYQRALSLRSAVDFDDLIWLALTAMQADPAFLQRLRQRWLYILEDEAQDSSRLQEEILRTLSGDGGNWVRVGDPNQAIFETFTTADPRFLINFLEDPYVLTRDLPNSGRSAQSIIDLANYLVEWSATSHPTPDVRGALRVSPLIEPAPPGDPQPNPPDETSTIHLIVNRFAPDAEIKAIADSLARWLPDHSDATVAALTYLNEHAQKLVEELRARGLPVNDNLLRTTQTVRRATRLLESVLISLANPADPRKLAEVYRLWQQQIAQSDEETEDELVKLVVTALQRLPYVEEYLWPAVERDWLASREWLNALRSVQHRLDDAMRQGLEEELIAFRQVCQRWQGAAVLPIDQLLLTVSQDLFTQPGDLAIVHKLAVLLRQTQELNPDWRLPQLANELGEIARNQRRFLGFSDEERGFDPDRYPGQVVVATMHKAKGLEWDRVYLMSANSYDFPSLESDEFYDEKWFLRDKLNLSAEGLAQLKAVLDPGSGWPVEGQATRRSRLDTIRERLRLFYVGITRARRELIVTSNTGRGQGRYSPSLPLVALEAWWKAEHDR